MISIKSKLSVLFFAIFFTALAFSLHSAFASDSSVYNLELKKWNIHNDGTHSIETTKGLNNALQWAKTNGKTTFKVPSGTYLIAAGNRINMVSNMVLELDKNAILQKETNSLEIYDMIYMGSDVKNAIVRGGTLRGDRDTHDYSKKGRYTGGTHEWGYGINISGAENVIIENMKIEKMTGDGIFIGGVTIAGSYITTPFLEQGSLDKNGKPIPANGKIRSVGRTQTNLDNKAYKTHRNVHMWLPKGLTSDTYDICYYRSDNSFISCDKERKAYFIGSNIPEGADYFRVVFNASSVKNVNVNRMTIDNSKNIIIQNNDIGYNRRQGITAGGEEVQILNNKIHHTRGTAPQSGIDIEPGFFPAINHLIKGNEFNANKIQIVLSYGEGATIEENTFIRGDVPGHVGVHIHEGYQRSTVNNNKFDGSGLTLQPQNIKATGNTFKNAQVKLLGGNIEFDNAALIDTSLTLGEKAGTKAININITLSGTNKEGALYLGKKTAHLKNVTITGASAANSIISGYGSDDNVYENLVIDNDGKQKTLLTSGKYYNCTMNTAGLSINISGKYLLDDCDITGKNSLLNVEKTHGDKMEVMVQNSNFVLTDKIGYAAAVYVLGTDKIDFLNNTFTANYLSSATVPFMKFGPYGNPKLTKIFNVVVKENTFKTNLAVSGIHTSNAGTNSAPYVIENNTLYKAKLDLKGNDSNKNNMLLVN